MQDRFNRGERPIEVDQDAGRAMPAAQVETLTVPRGYSHVGGMPRHVEAVGADGAGVNQQQLILMRADHSASLRSPNGGRYSTQRSVLGATGITGARTTPQAMQTSEPGGGSGVPCQPSSHTGRH